MRCNKESKRPSNLSSGDPDIPTGAVAPERSNPQRKAMGCTVSRQGIGSLEDSSIRALAENILPGHPNQNHFPTVAAVALRRWFEKLMATSGSNQLIWRMPLTHHRQN